ncbi:MAG: VCBS repeat-containing protein, partial [Bacteroidota bacterium]
MVWEGIILESINLELTHNFLENRDGGCIFPASSAQNSRQLFTMKFTLLFLLFSITQISFAQVFLERPQTPPIDSVSFGAIAFADVDGDSDQDLLITGQNAPGLLIAKLYLNDGGGNFSEKTGTPFKAVSASAIAFADVDGDSDQDLFITGQGRFDSLFSILYLNDGVGNFTEVADPPFDSVDAGSVAFADVDGDADKDLLITGRSISGVRIAKLYANDGGGGFSEVMGTPFEGVFENSIAFADVDGDTDQDVLITGGRDDGVRISKLYTNDGAGNFTEMLGTPFEGVTSSSVAIAD